jgi:hypothetical protein
VASRPNGASSPKDRARWIARDGAFVEGKEALPSSGKELIVTLCQYNGGQQGREECGVLLPVGSRLLSQ